MSESHDGVNADPSSYGRRDNILQHGRPSAIMAPLQPPTTANHHDNRSPRFMRTSSYPPLWLKSIGFEGLVVTAVAVFTILLNMAASSSTANTTVIRAFLFFGMMFELLAILLTICFLNIRDWAQVPVILRLASGLPIVFLLMGIVVLAAVLVVEMLKTSLGVAVAMGGFLIFGIVLGLLTSFFGV